MWGRQQNICFLTRSDINPFYNYNYLIEYTYTYVRYWGGIGAWCLDECIRYYIVNLLYWIRQWSYYIWFHFHGFVFVSFNLFSISIVGTEHNYYETRKNIWYAVTKRTNSKHNCVSKSIRFTIYYRYNQTGVVITPLRLSV